MKSYFKQISRYFRQSLIDADRLSPEDKDILPILGNHKPHDANSNYIALNHSVWHYGKVDALLAQKVISERQPKNKPDQQEIEIAIFPRVDYLNYYGGQFDSRKRRVLLPLVVFVNLHRDGSLSPTTKSPYVPRAWVSPSQGAHMPFTEMATLDEFFTLNPFEGTTTWDQLKSYCTKLLCHATGTVCGEQHTTGVTQITLSEDYSQSDQCLLQLEPTVVGAKQNLIKIIDFLIDNESYPKLYQTYSRRENALLDQYRDKSNSVNYSCLKATSFQDSRLGC